MNRVFKVIFNHATQSWVAVSELQKAKSKTKSLSLGSNIVRQSSPMLKFSLISSGLLLASGQVMAVTGTVGSSTTGQCYSDTASKSIVCGDSPKVSESIVIGFGANANAEGGYAIGHGADAERGSLAFGSGANAIGDRSGALGTMATATHDYSWALGYDSRASGVAAVAIGMFSTAMHNYSVALGSSSLTEDVVGTKSAEINSIQYGDFAGDTPFATVSVGNKDYGEKRTITNVAAGRITATSTDAINGSQLYIIADKLSKDINAAKVKVVGGEGVTVASNSDANGTVYTVTVNTNNTAIKIDTSGNITANTGKITPADDAGKVAAQNEKGAKLATVDNVAESINSAGWVVNTGKAADQNSFDTAASNHQATKISAGSKVNFQAGKNMEVKRDGENIIYATSDNVSFNTVTVGNTKITNDGVSIVNGPSMTKDGIDAGGHRITNVKPGRPGTTDAVNMQQLRDATINIHNQLNKMDKRRKAGHASGLAVAGLMQAYREGQSAVTAGVAQYQNQTAVAVGYSRIADSGKYGVKAAFTANTQGEVGGTLSAGYFW
ncbi:hypothetical protein BKG93_04290 [Rodentibacter ratti]|uniref:Adhesin n=1 Tax=Rodentibacter ratti TaxID=1906745 RepID=A0A1V3L6U9_9PAST|nr:ESPR-type extended signal peptide-containing protein [Rodentibacter ratti]OOF85595.1 hypothetical protein BKG93_04290 [Rodentibacter ratti]